MRLAVGFQGDGNTEYLARVIESAAQRDHRDAVKLADRNHIAVEVSVVERQAPGRSLDATLAD